MSLTFRTLLLLSTIARVFGQEAAAAVQDAVVDAEEDGVARDEHEEGDSEQKAHEVLTDNHLHQVHAEWDANGDAKVSFHELMNFTEAHHSHVLMSEVSMEDVLEEKDTNKDGRVSLEEHLNDTVYSERWEDAEKEKKMRIDDETALFKAADANNDGLLDKHELGAVVFPETHEGATNALMDQTMRDADENGDGKITIEEFKNSDMIEADTDMADEVKETDQVDEEDALFKRLDKNGDGFLEKEELRPLKTGRIERENMVNELVGALDKDGDSHVDSAELVQGKKSVYDSDLQDYLLAWARRRQVVR